MIIENLKNIFSKLLETPLTSSDLIIRDHFKAHKEIGNKAMLVLQSEDKKRITCLGVPRDLDTEKHLDWNRRQSPALYHSLLGALDTQKPFADQWWTPANRMNALQKKQDAPFLARE